MKFPEPFKKHEDEPHEHHENRILRYLGAPARARSMDTAYVNSLLFGRVLSREGNIVKCRVVDEYDKEEEVYYGRHEMERNQIEVGDFFLRAIVMFDGGYPVYTRKLK